MKMISLVGGIGVLVFALAGYQAGLFRDLPRSPSSEVAEAPAAEVTSQPKKEEKKPSRARFPQDLAPAARAEPVPQAAAYDPQAKFNRMAILKTTGALFQDWQDKLREEWQAESVEDTALVVVVGPQKKIFLQRIPYPGGAPPIDRFKYELEASVVEAKTGRVLANQLFVNVARQIVRIETWDTTALGSPVEFRTIFNWAAAGARAGFPLVPNPSPIVNVVN